MFRPRASAVAAATVVFAAGCTAGSGPSAPSAPPVVHTSASSSAASCPSAYAAPNPHRPQVRLSFAVPADHASVTGTEHVVFTPDKRITELVFRLTANSKSLVASGTSIKVTSASGDHNAGAPTYTADNAAPATQGGLLHLPYPAPIAAGTTVSADVGFTVTLGTPTFDRIGRGIANGATYAWFGSAQPLLAWQFGYGWHDEPMLDFGAESATSEAMRTDLTVSAPAADTVIMSGDPRSGTPMQDGTRLWHATLDAARDVSVAAGPFAVSDTTVPTMAGRVALRVGATSPAQRDALVTPFTRALTELARRFGPYPFPSLVVARIPGDGGGIEYPGAVLMVSDSQSTVPTHETAHQWFYAMVGNSQDLHAWLDEAFASYAEQLVDGDAPASAVLDRPGVVDTPAFAYGTDEAAYIFVTYDKGSAALHAARQAAGAQAFDAALRCYVNANAWRIADPSDVAAALKSLPAAIAVLKKAGALP